MSYKKSLYFCCILRSSSQYSRGSFTSHCPDYCIDLLHILVSIHISFQNSFKIFNLYQTPISRQSLEYIFLHQYSNELLFAWIHLCSSRNYTEWYLMELDSNIYVQIKTRTLCLLVEYFCNLLYLTWTQLQLRWMEMEEIY